jgi:hypothetical protein
MQLECLKLAMEQARRELTHDLIRVAELQAWFYNRIAIAQVSDQKSVGKGKAKAADKSSDPFA